MTIRTIISRILNYDLSFRKKGNGVIKVGNRSNIEGATFEFRKSTDNKIRVTIGDDCLITGNYYFETGTGSIKIGDRVFIGGSTFVCVDYIEIGNDVLFSWGCTVVDNNSHSLIATERTNDVLDWKKGIEEGKTGHYKDWTNVKYKPVIIRDKAWIGFNVIILKGVTIGEGSIVGAGSVVTKDVPDWTVVAGNPAKVVRRLK